MRCELIDHLVIRIPYNELKALHGHGLADWKNSLASACKKVKGPPKSCAYVESRSALLISNIFEASHSSPFPCNRFRKHGFRSYPKLPIATQRLIHDEFFTGFAVRCNAQHFIMTAFEVPVSPCSDCLFGLMASAVWLIVGRIHCFPLHRNSNFEGNSQFIAAEPCRTNCVGSGPRHISKASAAGWLCRKALTLWARICNESGTPYLEPVLSKIHADQCVFREHFEYSGAYMVHHVLCTHAPGSCNSPMACSKSFTRVHLTELR
jgi:hypothetical protein